MSNYERLFNKEVVAQTITDSAVKDLGFIKFVPKVPLAAATDYYTYFIPELSWDEAKKKGKLGKTKKLAEGAEFEPLSIRDYKTKTESFNLFGGQLTMTKKQMDDMPLQSQEILKEATRLIIAQLNKDFNEEYDSKAKIKYNQSSGDDLFDLMIEVQGKTDEANLNCFALDSPHYTSLRKYMKDQKMDIQPVEEIKTYFNAPNIAYQDGFYTKGGADFGTNKYKSLDLNNSGVKVLYSPRDGTTQAPVNDAQNALAPVMNIKINELGLNDDPATVKFFISAQALFLFDKPDILATGSLQSL